MERTTGGRQRSWTGRTRLRSSRCGTAASGAVAGFAVLPCRALLPRCIAASPPCCHTAWHWRRTPPALACPPLRDPGIDAGPLCAACLQAAEPQPHSSRQSAVDSACPRAHCQIHRELYWRAVWGGCHRRTSSKSTVGCMRKAACGRGRPGGPEPTVPAAHLCPPCHRPGMRHLRGWPGIAVQVGPAGPAGGAGLVGGGARAARQGVGGRAGHQQRWRIDAQLPRADTHGALATMLLLAGQRDDAAAVWAGQGARRCAAVACQPTHACASLPQVVWHLQLRDPPVLPPIQQLFGEGSGRPLQGGKAPKMSQLQARCCLAC